LLPSLIRAKVARITRRRQAMKIEAMKNKNNKIINRNTVKHIARKLIKK
jgi:hypothetical protein